LPEDRRSWESKRVLITGIGGFVGSHLGKYLASRGAEVFGLVRRGDSGALTQHATDRNIENFAHLITGDLLDSPSLIRAIDESQPDVIYHLAAQSFVPYSLQRPSETYAVNLTGTMNLLEAVRTRGIFPTVVFAGSSEEYGLVFATRSQYESYVTRHGPIIAEPVSMPELPVKETNPLRPMSPYAVAKLQADYMMRNYTLCWGIPTVVSRAFNTEGADRGGVLVTSTIARQVARAVGSDGSGKIAIGNVNPFRDWSHVNDVVRGFALLAERGAPAGVYNQGSQRTNSVLSYLLLALQEAGSRTHRIESFKNRKVVEDPLTLDREPVWGTMFEKSKVDSLMLKQELSFELEDEGIWAHTDTGKIAIHFDADRFRPSELPILLADTSKIRELGFKVEHSLSDIVREQVEHYMNTDSHQGRPAQ
jgi:GDP-D-mannose dehydratase